MIEVAETNEIKGFCSFYVSLNFVRRKIGIIRVFFLH